MRQNLFHFKPLWLSILAILALLPLGTSCKVPGKATRFNINRAPGFTVFAVTVKEQSAITETSWYPVKVQTTTSNASGDFTLHTPPKGGRHKMVIAISKPGYRAWVGEVHGSNGAGPDTRSGKHFTVKKAGSNSQESVAIHYVGETRHLREACDHDRFKRPCAVFKRHLEMRKRYLVKRYPPSNKPRVVRGTALVPVWPKLRKEHVLPVSVAQVNGGLIAVLESHPLAYYQRKLGRDYLSKLRNNSRLRRDRNLVLIDGRGRVVFEAPVPGTRLGEPVMTRVDAGTLAVLSQQGVLRTFDVASRTFGKPLRLSDVKGYVRAVAVTPGDGPIFVGLNPHVLQRHDRRGKRQHHGPLAKVKVIRKIAVIPGGDCLVFGALPGNYDYTGARFGNLWKGGMPIGVVRTGAQDKAWRETVVAPFAEQMWVTPQGFWVIRSKLFTHASRKMDAGERLARPPSVHKRLYFYGFDGTLRRSMNMGYGRCVKPPAAGADLTRRDWLVHNGALSTHGCGAVNVFTTQATPP